jgi:predicted porin
MKKLLIATAALAMVAGTAQAQSSVTVYGIVDMGYAINTDDNNGRETTGVKAGNQSGNRLGFRGTEDLGGGLKANFTVETGFDPTGNQTNLLGYRDTAAGHASAPGGTVGGTVTTATNRQSWVGLSGGFGEARIGWQYTVDYTITSLSGIQQTTESTRGGTAHLHTNLASRATGATYYSPKFANLQVIGFIGEASDETTATDTKTVDADVYNLGAIYSAGPLVAGISMGQQKTAQTTGTQRPDADSLVIGASYTLGAIKVGATYGENESKTNAGVKTDKDHYQLSASYTLGKTVLLASFGNKTTDAAGVTTADVDMYQIGLNYNLSKRTNAYAYIGQEEDDKAAASSDVKKVKTTVVGVRHQF